MLDEVVDEVVELDDGAAVELVVAVVVDAPVLLAVVVDIVDAADVSAVVELVVDDEVVWPQAAMATRAPAAAKLKIKRIGSPLLPDNGTRRHRALICQTPWRNLTNLKVAGKAQHWPIGPHVSALDDVYRQPALTGFLVL